MSAGIEAAPSFVATIGGSKPGRALVVRVVNGNLHLKQPPADIIIIERAQLADFLSALNDALSALTTKTDLPAGHGAQGEPATGSHVPPLETPAVKPTPEVPWP